MNLIQIELNCIILKDNMRKDVKIYWQKWTYVIRYMLRKTNTLYLNYFAVSSL